MKKALIILFALACLVYAGQRKVIKKIVVADTVTTIKVDTIKTVKVDTIKTVKYDTLLVRQLVRDSSWVLKADTVNASEVGKPKVAPAKDKADDEDKKAPQKNTRRK